MAEAATRRRFTIEEYHRMGEAGILGEDERLELIAGHIVVREPIGSRHAGTVDRLNRIWTFRLGEQAILRVQNPVVLPNQASELQPDLMLLTATQRLTAEAFPDLSIAVGELLGPPSP